MLIRKCDKCGKEQDNTTSFAHFSTTGRYIKGDFDLCEDCAAKLNDWFKEKEVTDERVG